MNLSYFMIKIFLNFYHINTYYRLCKKSIVIERFFRTLKYNCIFINDFKDVTELKEGINNYMDKYNNQRFHYSIGYQKPMNVYRDYLQNAA